MLTYLLVFLAVAGIGALIRFLIRKPAASGFGAGASFPPGTRAFEAEMSLDILEKMVAARQIALRTEQDPTKRADLERQLSNLRSQTEIHQATIAARDLSPGRMRVGVNPDSPTVD